MPDEARAAAQMLDERRARIASVAVEREFERNPHWLAQYGERGRAKCIEDSEYHLRYLAAAVRARRPVLLHQYLAWARVFLAGLGMTPEHLAGNLTALREAIAADLPAQSAAPALGLLDAGLAGLPDLPDSLPSYIRETSRYGALAAAYLDALLATDRRRAGTLIRQAVEKGAPIADLYLEVFQACQHEIGRLWQLSRVSVAHEHFCTAATQQVMSQLYEYIFSGRRDGPTLVAATVGGDLHELGARMIADLAELEGWNTLYLGANVPASSLVRTVAEHQASVVGISATMSFHLGEVERVIQALRQDAATRGVKILVGGHPFNHAHDMWRDLGADGCAADAVAAVALARDLTGWHGPS